MIYINHLREAAHVVVPVLIPVVAVQTVLVEVAENETVAVRVQEGALCHPWHCQSTRVSWLYFIWSLKLTSTMHVVDKIICI